MKNSTFSYDDWEELLPKSIIKKYICDEITGRYIQSRLTNLTDALHMEQRDEIMAKYIHSLFRRSKKGRYFFVVGAGMVDFVEQN